MGWLAPDLLRIPSVNPSGPLNLLRRERSTLVRKRRIKERKGVRRLDNSSPFPSLLFCNLLMQLFHFRPVQFRTEMMLGVVPVVEPERVINFLVRTHTPGDRLIWISAIVQEVPVQIRETMPNIIEWQEK